MTGPIRTVIAAGLVLTLWAAPSFAQSVLKVGAVPFGGPITFLHQESDEFRGYMVDLVAEIAADNGFEVEFVSLLFQDLSGALEGGDIDMIAGIFVDTEANRATFGLSAPLYSLAEGLFAHVDDDADYRSPADLAGMIIGMQIGTYAMIEDAVDFADVQRFDSLVTVLTEVNEGRVPLGIVGGPSGRFQLFVGNFPNVRAVGGYEPMTGFDGVIAVQPDDAELLEQINASIAKFEADGTLADIFARYGATYIPLD